MLMTHPTSRSKGSGVSKKNTKIVHDAVSGRLKAFYDDIADQDVPDRFLDLLKRIDDAAGGGKS